MATPSTWLELNAAILVFATKYQRPDLTDSLHRILQAPASHSEGAERHAPYGLDRFCEFLAAELTEALRTRRAVARSIDKRDKAYPAPSALWTWEWKVRGTIDGFGVWRSSENIEERWQIAFSLPQPETLPDSEWLSLADAALTCGHHGASHYAEGYRRFLNQRLTPKASPERISFEGSAEGLADWLWDALRDGDLTARFINQEMKPSVIPQDRWRTPLSIRYSASDFIVLNNEREFDPAVHIALQPASLIEDASTFDDAASSPPPDTTESETTDSSPAQSTSSAADTLQLSSIQMADLALYPEIQELRANYAEGTPIRPIVTIFVKDNLKRIASRFDEKNSTIDNKINRIYRGYLVWLKSK